MSCWYETVPGVYLYVLVYLVGYLQQNVPFFFLFMGGLIRQGIFWAMQRCSVGNTYCMVHIPPCLSDTARMIHVHSVGLELAEALLGMIFSKTKQKRK